MKRIQKRKLGYEILEDRRMLAAVCPDCGPALDPTPEIVTSKQDYQNKLDHQIKQDRSDKQQAQQDYQDKLDQNAKQIH